MTQESPLKIEHRDGVCLLTLNAPERRNALSRAMSGALRTAVLEADGDPQVRVIAITGTGTAFCSGADLKEASGNDDKGIRFVAPTQRLERPLFEILIDSPKPSIAIVNGPATAGGCELSLACDIRVASTTAWFSLPEAKRGMGANFGTVLLPQMIPPGIAMEWLYTGRRVPIEEAQRWGLVNHVVPPEELMARAMALAADIVASAPLTVTRMKLNYRKTPGMPLHAALRLAPGPDPYASEDRKEGARAFIEKRAPKWTGK